MFKSWSKHLTSLAVVLVIFAIFAGPASVYAQDIAIAQATANVLAVLVVTATHDLVFGDVFQGVPHDARKSVIAEAGVFQVTGEGGKEVALYLQLPDYLWNTANTDRLAISFDDDDADIDTVGADTPASHGAGAITDVDPHNLPSKPLSVTDKVLQIFLGGTVFPTVDQEASAYTADIILTAAYTGN